MRALPVLLLVIVAAIAFFLVFPFGGSEPAPITPDGPVAGVTTVDEPADTTPADLQTPDGGADLSAVPSAADRQKVTSPQATLANSIQGIVQADGSPVEGATVTLTRFGQLAILFGEPTADQRADDESVLTRADGSFEFRNVETYTEFSLIAKHPDLGRKEEGNIQIAEGEARTGIVIVLGDGVRLHGRVTDSAGNAIEDATLSLGMSSLGALADVESPHTLSARTQPDGTYEFRSVANGNYSLTAQAEGFGRVTVQQLNITGQASVERNVTLDIAHMIGGIVTSAEGLPLAGATVQAFSLTNRKEATRSEVLTNKTGEFLFDDVGAGVYTLMFSAKGFKNERKPRIETGEMALNVALTPLPQIHGRVVDGLGQPVANFSVLLRTPIQGTETTMAMPDTLTRVKGSSNGSFSLSCPNHGEYVVEAQAKGHAPSFSEAFEIVYGQELTGIVVQLKAGGILRGRVVDANGKGIAGARIKSHDTEYSDDPFWRSLPAFPSQATEMEVRSSASGDFELSGLAAATYQIDVRHAKYAQTIRTKIVVTDGELVEIPDVQLASGATVQGAVYGPSGKGLAGAMVQLQLEASADDFAVNLSSRTDSQGRYTFEHVPPGSYNIHAQRRSNDNPFQGSLDLKKTQTRMSLSEGESYVQDFNISN